MENKYYIPDISEFHVGFEFEVNQFPNLENVDKWVNFKVIGNYTYNMIHQSLVKNLIRVKYLDADDITSLGFEESHDEPGEWWHSFKGNSEIQLYLNDLSGSSDTNPSCTIYSDDRIVFSGFVKNKSELNRILNQVL